MDLQPGSSGAEDGKDEELICILNISRYRRVLKMHYMDSLTRQTIAEQYKKSRRGNTSSGEIYKRNQPGRGFSG